MTYDAIKKSDLNMSREYGETQNIHCIQMMGWCQYNTHVLSWVNNPSALELSPETAK